MKTCLHILIVSLNPHERLKKTLSSIFSQTYNDYRVIIKDGGSKDGSLQELIDSGFFNDHDNVKIIEKPDNGIYEGMNQAIEAMFDEIGSDDHYCLFLNCGDTFHDERVLERVAPYLKEYDRDHIIYGDQYNLIQQTVVSSTPKINEFSLYRNVPCHQVCFYSTGLFRKRAYEIRYRVRADYEHFLYCCFELKAECEHIDVIICDYEGGGYSETKENRKRSTNEHKEITQKYMPRSARKYRLMMLLTLAPLRTRIAENPKTSRIYNSIKKRIYSR